MKNIGLVARAAGAARVHEPLMSGISHGLEETFVRAGMRLVTRVVRERRPNSMSTGTGTRAAPSTRSCWFGCGTRMSASGFCGQLRIPFAAIVDAVRGGGLLCRHRRQRVDDAVGACLPHLPRAHSNVVYVKAPTRTPCCPTSVLGCSSTRLAACRFTVEVVSAELTADGASTATTATDRRRRRPSGCDHLR